MVLGRFWPRTGTVLGTVGVRREEELKKPDQLFSREAGLAKDGAKRSKGEIPIPVHGHYYQPGGIGAVQVVMAPSDVSQLVSRSS